MAKQAILQPNGRWAIFSAPPTTLIEAVRHFSDLQVCHDYMVGLKWPDGIFSTVSERIEGFDYTDEQLVEEWAKDAYEKSVERSREHLASQRIDQDCGNVFAHSWEEAVELHTQHPTSDAEYELELRAAIGRFKLGKKAILPMAKGRKRRCSG